ncbi:MAG TPA: hypothetical protein VLI40_11880, partial [Gemmatimonadaceae bacterium]|nr:hypothetical protein [Gemmatimonadaceae bacterium]
MTRNSRSFTILSNLLVSAAVVAAAVMGMTAYRDNNAESSNQRPAVRGHAVVHFAVAHDVSGMLAVDPNVHPGDSDMSGFDVPANAVAPDPDYESRATDTVAHAQIVVPPGAARVEQSATRSARSRRRAFCGRTRCFRHARRRSEHASWRVGYER